MAAIIAGGQRRAAAAHVQREVGNVLGHVERHFSRGVVGIVVGYGDDPDRITRRLDRRIRVRRGEAEVDVFSELQGAPAKHELHTARIGVAVARHPPVRAARNPAHGRRTRRLPVLRIELDLPIVIDRPHVGIDVGPPSFCKLPLHAQFVVVRGDRILPRIRVIGEGGVRVVAFVEIVQQRINELLIPREREIHRSARADRMRHADPRVQENVGRNRVSAPEEIARERPAVNDDRVALERVVIVQNLLGIAVDHVEAQSQVDDQPTILHPVGCVNGEFPRLAVPLGVPEWFYALRIQLRPRLVDAVYLLEIEVAQLRLHTRLNEVVEGDLVRIINPNAVRRVGGVLGVGLRLCGAQTCGIRRSKARDVGECIADVRREHLAVLAGADVHSNHIRIREVEKVAVFSEIRESVAVVVDVAVARPNVGAVGLNAEERRGR